MSVSPMQQAFLLMEAQRPGWFRETVSLADAGGGIVWCCPSLFFAGVPDPESPRTLIVLFAHGRMEAVRELACLCRGVLTGQGGNAASADARTGRRFPSPGF